MAINGIAIKDMAHHEAVELVTRYDNYCNFEVISLKSRKEAKNVNFESVREKWQQMCHI